MASGAMSIGTGSRAMSPFGGGGTVQMGSRYNFQQDIQGEQRRGKKAQQLYDQILTFEDRAVNFPGPLPVDLFNNLRNSIQQYEQLVGEQYTGKGRDITRLAPYRAPLKSSFVSKTPTAGTIAKRAEREIEKAAIKSKQEERKNLQWLSGYDERRNKLIKDLEHQSAQVRANARSNLANLELERQIKENKLATTIPVGVQQIREREQTKSEISNVIQGINSWIQSNPDKKAAISRMSKLLKEAQRPGADATAIAQMAESEAFMAEKTAQKEFAQKQELLKQRGAQQQSLFETQDAARLNRETRAREYQQDVAKQKAAAQAENANIEDIKSYRAKIESNISNIKSDIENLIGRLKSVGVVVNNVGKITKTPDFGTNSKLKYDVEGTRIELNGLIGELNYFQRELATAPSIPKTQTSSPASGNNLMSRDEFIAAFTEDYGRAPSEAVISAGRGKYWE